MDRQFFSHLLITTLFFLCLQIVYSQPVSQDKAADIATQFIESIQSVEAPLLRKSAEYQVSTIFPLLDPENGTQLGYLVHLQPKGFMILSAWTDGDPFVSYSLNDNWQENSAGESVYTQLIYSDLRSRQQQFTDDSLEEDKKMISVLTKEEAFYQWPEPGTSNTGGWVVTKWRQGYPYNQFCPLDTQVYPPRHSAVGCIAIAMAQVINFHHYIGGLQFDFTDRYTYKYLQINFDSDSARYNFPGFGELNRYLRSIDNKYKNAITLNDMERAALCFATGIVVKMGYTSTSSTIISGDCRNTAPPLINKFNYNNADYSLANKTSFEDDLIDNLMNGLPAVIYLYDHAVVADGYNTKGLFHLNFGLNEGNPKSISEVWFKPDGSSLPDRPTEFKSGIINIKPFPDAYDLNLIASSNHIQIPCTKIGQISSDQTLLITNEGAVPFFVEDILISENFKVSFCTDQYNFKDRLILLKPQETLELKIHFRPDKVGKFTGLMQILVYHEKQWGHLNIDLCGYGVEETGTTITDSEISGFISSQGSPYYICNNIRVLDGKRLEIEPGTSFLFTGPYSFTVGSNSRLIARGTEEDSIYFSTLYDQSRWNGIQIKNSGYDDTLSYCVVENVSSKLTLQGGQAPIYLYRSSPNISHSVIQHNQSQFRAAVYLYKSSAEISQCVLRDNTCTTPDGGGALYVNDSSPNLDNLLIIRNHAVKGGAIYSYKSSLILNNLTITENTAQKDGGAIFLAAGNYLEIYNTIIWHNRAYLLPTEVLNKKSSADTIYIQYSDIDTLFWDWIGGTSIQDAQYAFENGEGNSSDDPLFNNPLQNDYSLQKESPCIDKGRPFDDYNLEPQPNGDRINMGAYGGTGKATSRGIVSIIEKITPNAIHLDQNYPNPFNPITTIRYQLPISSDVDLSIFNILGQKVVTLVKERQAAGKYDIDWNASEFSSGTYFYLLVVGKYREVKKMVLIR